MGRDWMELLSKESRFVPFSQNFQTLDILYFSKLSILLLY